MAKYQIQAEGNDYGFSDYCKFEFEGCNFEFHMFRHYARALTVSVIIELDEDIHDELVLSFLLNEINREDLLHQIGYVHTENEYYLRVTKQILCTPNIGDADTMAQSLRDLKEYSLAILELDHLNLEESDLNAWKKYANITPRTQVDNAEEFWFSEVDSALSPFRKKTEIVYEDAEKKTRTMIDMMDGSAIYVGMNVFLRQGIIITYKQYPYLLSMKTWITEGKNGIFELDIEKAKELCETWNAQVHFSPSKFVLCKNPEGKLMVALIMTGLFAEECNTRTFVDFLCTFQKSTFHFPKLLKSGICF